MSMAEELVFRPLESGELPLVDGLLANADVADPKSECWGVQPGVMPANAGQAWGIFLRGALAGAAWLRPPQNGEAEIAAMLLPRGRWSMGLIVWAAEHLAKEAKRQGAVSLAVNLSVCGEHLADEMEFAQFEAPDPITEDHPCGKWTRSL